MAIVVNRTDAAYPRRARPVRRYWLGGGIIAASVFGSIALVLVAWTTFMHHAEGFQRIPIPGPAQVRVENSGSLLVYYEAARGTPAIAPTSIHVTDPAGTAVHLNSYTLDVTYDVPGKPGHVGRAVASFHAEPGTYQISVDATTGTLAVGDNLLWASLDKAIGAAILLLVGTTLGLAVLFIARPNTAGTSVADTDV